MRYSLVSIERCNGGLDTSSALSNLFAFGGLNAVLAAASSHLQKPVALGFLHDLGRTLPASAVMRAGIERHRVHSQEVEDPEFHPLRKNATNSAAK
jgi:hypothetical protein